MKIEGQNTTERSNIGNKCILKVQILATNAFYSRQKMIEKQSMPVALEIEIHNMLQQKTLTILAM